MPRVLILCLMSLLLFSKCRKIADNDIPYVNVNTVINVQTPEYFDLQAVGGWEYTWGGSMGILVYRSSFDTFEAYDRHAPYDVPSACRVEVDSTNITAFDPCSGSKFLLYDGSVVQGPSVDPLKRYNTHFDGINLTIYN